MANTTTQITQIRIGPQSSEQKPRLLLADRNPSLGVLAESAPGDFQPIN
jgi:hypothetical protein